MDDHLENMVYPPHAHQLKEFNLHKDTKAKALLWYMRTGKTKSCIDLFSYLHVSNKIVSVVILAPNGVHYNWTKREIPEHIWKKVDHTTFTWFSSPIKKSIETIREVDRFNIKNKLLIVAINSESLRLDRVLTLIKSILKKGPSLLIVDECHDFRTPDSFRTKRLRALAQKFKYKRILTGTPVDNTPLASYSQFGILGKGALGADNYEHFKKIYAIYGKRRIGNRSINKVIGYKNLDLLKKQINKWSTKVGRKGMPPFCHQTVYFEMSGYQLKLYEKLKKEFRVELDTGEIIDVPQTCTRLTKLQQVLSGFFLHQESVYYISDSARIKALQKILDKLDFDEKIIIWCKFKEDIKLVKQACQNHGMLTYEYHGSINPKQKQEAVDKLMGPHHIEGEAFIGQPRAGGSGLNLSKASTVIFYSHTFDSIERNQAKERATKMGGDPITLIDICGISSIDEYILKVLKEKRSISEEIMGKSYLREFLE